VFLGRFPSLGSPPLRAEISPTVNMILDIHMDVWHEESTLLFFAQIPSFYIDYDPIPSNCHEKMG